MLGALVGDVKPSVGGEVDDLPSRLASLVDAHVRHAHEARGLEFHVPSPRAVFGHALDVRVPLLVVLDEGLEVVAVGLHVRHRVSAQRLVVVLRAPALVAHRAEEAVSVRRNLLHAHPDLAELRAKLGVVVAAASLTLSASAEGGREGDFVRCTSRERGGVVEREVT